MYYTIISTNLFVVFLWILRSDGLITVTDPDGNQIQVAASSLRNVGGASMDLNSGILKCDVVKSGSKLLTLLCERIVSL